MKTIHASVNKRLLTRANRLFTGRLSGRIIEILQNARRAGATRVEITNRDGIVTVQDNGRGIDDFSTLLDLGGSAWDESLELSEDPCGVGLFCLAPREVTVRSNGQRVALTAESWTGTPVPILDDPEPVAGTLLQFQDETWDTNAVELHAVFSRMQVTVSGKPCPNVRFVSDQATAYPDLGCSIEVRESQNLDSWHRSCERRNHYGQNALINFHGQIVGFDFHGVGEHGLHYLIEMTGEPTGLRLMLPARTRVVENEVFEALKSALEVEAYRYLQRRGHHRLPYKQYLLAKELSVDPPEATPTYTAGLLWQGDPPEPVEVVMPKDFPLAKCYRMSSDDAGGYDGDEANVHLLAALGKLETPFIPVHIRSGFDGYSWSTLPLVEKVEVVVGKELHSDWMWSGTLTCVDSLTITAHLSDGRTVSSPVCMAIAPESSEESPSWASDHVQVTPEARGKLRASEIWHHLGGFSDEGDSYETQEYQFEQDLDRFWAHVIGPDEHLRQSLLAPLEGLASDWKSVTMTVKGKVTIRYADSTSKVIQPPVCIDTSGTSSSSI